MFDVKTRFLASVFVQANHIVPKGKDIASLSAVFDDDDFLPITAEEFSPAGIKQRIAFRTTNGEWLLMLHGERFDLSKNPTDASGSNMGDLADFCKSANRILGLVLEHYKVTPHRLAAVQEGILPGSTNAEMNQVAIRLLKFPGTDSENENIFEWDWRVARLIDREFAGVTEASNTIAIIKRVPVIITIGNAEPLPKTERLFGSFDINTNPGNAAPRFDPPKIIGFYENVVEWQRALTSEVFSHVFE